MGFVSRRRKNVIPRDEAARIEQRTLTLSLLLVTLVGVGSLFYGLWIQSDVVILNGIFTMFSLMGSWLNLTASKLITRPADDRFQYGYSHVEPIVHCVNGLMMALMCVYSLIVGIEGIRSGGTIVDAAMVIWFSVVTSIICGVFGLYELMLGGKLNSQLLRNDAREWLMDFGFSLVTLVGFAGLFMLPPAWQKVWVYYADSVMVVVMSLLLLPFPLQVLRDNMREVLRITNTQEGLVLRVNEAMEEIDKDHTILDYSTHIVKMGRTYFVEVSILVTPEFSLQTIALQDSLREIIWKACDKPLDELWLSVCITQDERWA
ncbi:cation diffusion facilitator family transporter [Desulfovibrio cuneatus]|uniref:cation diffusion facilitator family transporter n=1 Tax=Desulfovibrio cuneatus TaxID=159728 RepID=UPI000414791A|nr:cation diffusion facilitator family transporter [Desulfovibrio cuneatus]